MPIFNGPPKSRRGTSPGAHARALYAALAELAELVPKGRKPAVLAHLVALQRAYPFTLTATDSDIEQILAEEDGIPVEED